MPVADSYLGLGLHAQTASKRWFPSSFLICFHYFLEIYWQSYRATARVHQYHSGTCRENAPRVWVSAPLDPVIIVAANHMPCLCACVGAWLAAAVMVGATARPRTSLRHVSPFLRIQGLLLLQGGVFSAIKLYCKRLVDSQWDAWRPRWTLIRSRPDARKSLLARWANSFLWFVTKNRILYLFYCIYLFVGEAESEKAQT